MWHEEHDETMHHVASNGQAGKPTQSAFDNFNVQHLCSFDISFPTHMLFRNLFMLIA